MEIALVLGNFDGVHMGHQSLLKKGQSWKALKPKERSLQVLTFNPHPVALLRPPYVPLFDLKDRIERLHALGVEKVHVQNFDKAFSEMEAEQFVKVFLKNDMKASHLITGQNFFFGRNRKGNSENLKIFASEVGLTVDIGESLEVNSEIISTSKIKEALSLGHVEKAKLMLGRNYYLRGVVVSGDQRGRTIGFPTANVIPEVGGFLSRGVYCGWVTIASEARTYGAVVNLGVAPTLRGSNQDLRLEVHLLDFDADIYGKELKFEVAHFLRPERKMKDISELKVQIQKDSDQARVKLGL